MKLVGGDSGRYEREEFVESAILAPSERLVIDVLFEEAGQRTLEHRTPGRTYTLATIDVSAEQVTPSLTDQFESLRQNPEWVSERERLAPYFDAPPDKTLALVAEMDVGTPEGPVVYACPMHPEVVSEEAGSCPKCGMKLLATAASGYVCPMHPDVVSDNADHCPKCGMKLLPAAVVAQLVRCTATTRTHGPTDVSGRERSRPPPAQGCITKTRPPRSRYATVKLAGSSGKTTWSTSTGARRRRTCTGASSIERRRRQPRDRLAFSCWRPDQAAARQRDGLRPPDAPSFPCPRGRPLRRAGA